MEDAHQASKVLWLADDGGFPVHLRYGSRLVDGFAAETIAASRLVGGGMRFFRFRQFFSLRSISGVIRFAWRSSSIPRRRH